MIICAKCENDTKVTHFTKRGDGPFCDVCIVKGHDHTLCVAPTYDDYANERGFCPWCAPADHKKCGNPRAREWFVEGCLCCQRTLHYLNTGEIPPEVAREAAEEAATTVTDDETTEVIDLVPASDETDETDEDGYEEMIKSVEVYDPSQDCVIEIDVWAVYMDEAQEEPEFYELYEENKCWTDGVPIYFEPSKEFIQAWIVGDQAEIERVLDAEGNR